MQVQSLDTPPQVEEILVEGYRRMSPADKLRRVWELNKAALDQRFRNNVSTKGVEAPRWRCSAMQA